MSDIVHEVVQSVPSWNNNCFDCNKVTNFHVYKQRGVAFLLNVLLSLRLSQDAYGEGEQCRKEHFRSHAWLQHMCADIIGLD